MEKSLIRFLRIYCHRILISSSSKQVKNKKHTRVCIHLFHFCQDSFLDLPPTMATLQPSVSILFSLPFSLSDCAVVAPSLHRRLTFGRFAPSLHRRLALGHFSPSLHRRLALGHFLEQCSVQSMTPIGATLISAPQSPLHHLCSLECPWPSARTRA